MLQGWQTDSSKRLTIRFRISHLPHVHVTLCRRLPQRHGHAPIEPLAIPETGEITKHSSTDIAYMIYSSYIFSHLNLESKTQSPLELQIR